MRKIKGRSILASLLSLIIIGISIYNAFKNDKYFDFNIGSTLTLLVAITISYFLTQSDIDERKRKDFVDETIKKLQIIICDERYITIPNDCEIRLILQNNREVQNIIDSLDLFDSSYISENDMNYINKQFEQYQDFITRYQSNMQHLCESKYELSCYINNINATLHKIRMNMHGFK